MRLTTRALKLVNNQALEVLKKTIKSTIAEAPQYLNSVKESQKRTMYNKFVNLNKWYTQIIGLDEVKVCQDRVTYLQDELLKTQEKRREVGKQLADVRLKSLELQDQIHKVNRQVDINRFLELMREESDIVKLEKSITTIFQDYDQTERDLFSAFTNAIRDSHEKQRAQLEYTKYFGLILSIAGSFLAFLYTTVRKQDLKNFIEEKLSSIELNTAEPVVLNLAQANDKTIQEVLRNRQELQQVAQVNDKTFEVGLRNTEMLQELVTVLKISREENRMFMQQASLPVTPLTEEQVVVLKLTGCICLFFVLIKVISNL